MKLLALLLSCATAVGETPERFDVHEAMRHDDETGCEFCHEEQGEALQVEAFETCRGCHRRSTHAGLPEHRVKLEEPMAQRARRAELPLDPQGEVGCLTCHDAHPDGSVEHRPAHQRQPPMPEAWRRFVWGQAQLVQGSDMMRHPEGGLCQACHGAGGEL